MIERDWTWVSHQRKDGKWIPCRRDNKTAEVDEHETTGVVYDSRETCEAKVKELEDFWL